MSGHDLLLACVRVREAYRVDVPVSCAVQLLTQLRGRVVCATCGAHVHVINVDRHRMRGGAAVPGRGVLAARAVHGTPAPAGARNVGVARTMYAG